MALYKRGCVWWIRFTTPSGHRIRESSGTEDRRQAQEFHDRRKAESWRVDQLGERPIRIWEEAALRWLKETEHKASHKEDIAKLAWLQQFLKGKELSEITRDVITSIGEIKKGEASASTANRYLGLIRSILRRAALDWEWIAAAPRVRLYPEPLGRERWLTQADARRLLAELPEHLAEMVRFTLATGLRQSNVTGLKWAQVDLTRGVLWVQARQMKARRSHAIPLLPDAVAVLTRQVGKHPVFVFTYSGNAVRQVNTKAWTNALRRAGIDDFRWHDLRHTWATWLRQAGVPADVLQALGAWSSASMVSRYAHWEAEALRDRLVGIRLFPALGDGTNVAQGGERDDV